MKKNHPKKLHLGGEGLFVFPTAGGSVGLSASNDALTLYGGMVPWGAFARRTKIIENLARIFHTDSSRGAANPDVDKEGDGLRRRLYV